MENILQIIGLVFVGIIMICIGWTIVEYIVTSVSRPGNQNRKLLENINKLKNEKWQKN